MPYVAEHKEWCKNQSRYITTRIKIEVESSRGVILDNSDPGWVASAKCASCAAHAKWDKVSTNISVGKKTPKLSIPGKPVNYRNIST